MAGDHDVFDLNELARAADVTPRTVRYYVQQGLLAPPGTRGPGARYDRRHLDRLLLIKRWQKLHLPLAEVRRRLEQMGDDEVAAALSETASQPAPDSALDYVRALMRPSTPAPPPAPLAAPGFRAPGVSRLPSMADHVAFSPPHDARETTADPLSGGARSVEAPDGAPEEAPDARSALRSTWERIPVTSDIELHLRRPLTREHNRLAERLLEFARQLFQEEG